ncbi:hypothetical protein DM01DRAFT_357709 [Hesseltinella vesiculosa]|uniref:Uncharacterized protein n=1 Tax=Hesseltinella vesiculosa TaxID=101127 RepID=A0A1X2GBJ0_9FUNG|nr:hypothetical protein DM01DRAFT_357709 [Hesseltinella vesiculosa]
MPCPSKQPSTSHLLAFVPFYFIKLATNDAYSSDRFDKNVPVLLHLVCQPNQPRHQVAIKRETTSTGFPPVVLITGPLHSTLEPIIKDVRRDTSLPIVKLDRRNVSGEPPTWLSPYFVKAGTYQLPFPPDVAKNWIHLIRSIAFDPEAPPSRSSALPPAMPPPIPGVSPMPPINPAMLGMMAPNSMFPSMYNNGLNPAMMMGPNPQMLAMNNWSSLSHLQQQQQLLLYQQQLQQQAMLQQAGPLPLPTPTPPIMSPPPFMPVSSAIAAPSPSATPVSASSYTQRKPVNALVPLLNNTHLSNPSVAGPAPTSASQSMERRKAQPSPKPPPAKPKRRVQFKSTDMVYEFDPDSYWKEDENEDDQDGYYLDDDSLVYCDDRRRPSLHQQVDGDYYDDEDYYDEDIDDYLQHGTAYDRYDESDYEQRYYLDQYYHHHQQLPPMYHQRPLPSSHAYRSRRLHPSSSTWSDSPHYASAYHRQDDSDQLYWSSRSVADNDYDYDYDDDDQRHETYQRHRNPSEATDYYTYGDEEPETDPQEDDWSDGQEEQAEGDDDDAFSAPRPRSTGYYPDPGLSSRHAGHYFSPQLAPTYSTSSTRPRMMRYHSAQTQSPSSHHPTRAASSAQHDPPAASLRQSGSDRTTRATTASHLWQPSRSNQQQWTPSVRRTSSNGSTNSRPLTAASPSRRPH